MSEKSKELECEPTEHNFIPLFSHADYIGVVCSKCGKRIKESK